MTAAHDRWPAPVRDPLDDSPRLECGVFGVFDTPEAAGLTALGLHALQHRGQEACGIACFDGQRFHTERHMGHVGEAFGGVDLTERLPGRFAIGHTRYSTSGGSFIRNVQPMFADMEAGGVALAHNGNLTNFLDAARPTGQQRRDLPVDLGLRGDPPPYRPLPEGPLRRPVHRRPGPDRGRLCTGGPDQQEADRGARSPGHPAAGAGRPRRQADPGLGDPARSTSSAPASSATSNTARW